MAELEETSVGGRTMDRRPLTHDDGAAAARRLNELVADSLVRHDNDDVDAAVPRGFSGSGRRTIRVYRLYNRCSMKYVRTAGRRVDATAPHHDIYSAYYSQWFLPPNLKPKSCSRFFRR